MDSCHFPHNFNVIKYFWTEMTCAIHCANDPEIPPPTNSITMSLIEDVRDSQSSKPEISITL